MKINVKSFVLENYYTLLCVCNTQRRQEIYANARRTHLHMVEVAPCLTYLASGSQASLRDKRNTWHGTCAKVSRTFYH